MVHAVCVCVCVRNALNLLNNTTNQTTIIVYKRLYLIHTRFNGELSVIELYSNQIGLTVGKAGKEFEFPLLLLD